MASIWKELAIFLFLSAESGEQEPTNRQSLMFLAQFVES